jgi:biotin-dependent carboxylase-like uncharacterized protein
MTGLRIERTGPRTTVQDLGRPGYADRGVPRAGAADRAALRHANLLVGNDGGAAALESTLGGLVVTALADLTIACVGAALTIGETKQSRPIGVAVGEVIRVRTPPTGVYSYLAVAGGIDSAVVLGSRSTDTLSGLGPAVLQPGDVLSVGQPVTTPFRADDIAPTHHQGAGGDAPLRVVLGPRDDWFTVRAMERLLESEWTVQPDSDRTGLRLRGPALERRVADELPSEGMVAGAIQVPPDGQPIVFLANHPTTGGYPVIAVVVTADVDRAAQHRPGQRIRFVVL